VRIESLVDQEANSRGEAKRFPGAWTSDDEHRAQLGVNGALLLRKRG